MLFAVKCLLAAQNDGMCAVFFLILGHNQLVSPTRATQKAPFSNFSSAGFVHLVAKTYFCVMNRFYSCLVFVCSLLLIGCTGSRRQPPECRVPRLPYIIGTPSWNFPPRNAIFCAATTSAKSICAISTSPPIKSPTSPCPLPPCSGAIPFPTASKLFPCLHRHSCLDAAPASLDTLADRIARRVEQMSTTNDCDSRVREVQIDCDWTAQTASAYFAFLRRLRSTLTAHGLGLSATIRLHQLSQAPPPVDYGVLMLYNTGDPRDVSNPNPILRLRDVKPFVSGIADYPLPLSAAYPDYHWQRLVGGGRYKGLLYAERLDDSTVYRRVRPDAYVVISSRYVSPVAGGSRESDVLLVPGDSVFVHDSNFDEIRAVRAELSRRRPDLHRQVILYPLDSKNIERHSSSRYEEIYRP